MGAVPARITAADFVTPGELAVASPTAHPAGRIGGVCLELQTDRDQTRLGACYQQVPLRVLPPWVSGPGQPALVYLLNPTAGLLDGDAQLVRLTARTGSRAVVTGQSATRIHPCLHAFSTQQWHVHVEKGAVLVVLPGPAIPYRGCRYYQRVRIELEEGASLLWGDLWLAGRHARGAASELFQFTSLTQDLVVRRAGRAVFRDHFHWQGPWDTEAMAWHVHGALACGSLFVTGPVEDEGLALDSSLAEAVFPTAAQDTCLRWYGTPEAVLTRLVTVAFRLAARLDGRGGQEPWLLTGHGLGPNHWFTPRVLHNPG